MSKAVTKTKNPIKKTQQFVSEVQSETKKVTWPNRKETTVSTIAVFVMVFLSALFLFFADQILAFLIQMILGLGLS